MGERTCAVAGCEKPPRNRSAVWCDMHYQRWRRSGELGGAESQHRTECSVPGCTSKHAALGYCATHYFRVWRHGDATVVAVARTTGAANARWAGADVGYRGAHHRVRRAKGEASQHACRDCGASAHDWAYDHQDPNERVDGGKPYSANVEHYAPLCVACHRVLDDAPVGRRLETQAALPDDEPTT